MKEGWRLGLRRALLTAVAVSGGAGAYWSARLAYAEWLCDRGTPQAVEHAARMAPGDAEIARRRFDLAEAAALNPAKAAKALEGVLRVKPGDPEALIELGLRAEVRKDFAAAERDLLEAARHDRGYTPRWSLANYYFRRQDGQNFWKWARAACEMAYEPVPLFRLLWNYTDNGPEILERAIPDQPEILRQYLWFLASGPHWEAADTAAKRILKRPAVEDAPVLMAYCDRLLVLGQGPQALEVWNALARRNLSGFGEIDPARGPVDGGFRTPPSSRGFDWRIAAVEGIEVSQDEPGLRLSFSGEEPEAWEPLWQYVVLKAGTRYQMTFETATSGVAKGSGLRWRVVDLTGEPAVIAESGDLANEDGREAWMSFTTPAGMRLGRLDLSYRRAPGTTRIEGSIRLRKITLAAVRAPGRAD